MSWSTEVDIDTPLSVLDIDGGTDIGADITDADLFIVDDGGGGTIGRLLPHDSRLMFLVVVVVLVLLLSVLAVLVL